MQKYMRKPEWLRYKMKFNKNFYFVSKILNKYNVNTICTAARCPNIYDCWGVKTATFLILGDICTRNCRFCGVKKGNPQGYIDNDEPIRVALAAKELGLKYVVITSVNRDDLSDGGAKLYVDVIKCIREYNPNIMIEVLTPDFNGDPIAISRIIKARPNIFGHNIETVKRITPNIRDRRASYEKSLWVLKYVKKLDRNIITKSSLILGFGETFGEVVDTMIDLRLAGVDILTLGQYLPPSPKHYPIIEYISPEAFKEYERIGYKLGYKYVVSGPNIRSSYMSAIYIESIFNGGS